MKYFFDTEFIEGFHKPLFGKRRHFIDLISIGIVAQDGREYYGISNEFDPNKASDWVKENVLYQIIEEYIQSTNGDKRQMVLAAFGNKSHEKCIRLIQDWIGKSHKQIAAEIIFFMGKEKIQSQNIGDRKVRLSDDSYNSIIRGYSIPEFYGYYADYDWVLFCSLFGTMMDLPKEFPMFCMDLQQMMHEKASLITAEEKEYELMSTVNFDENNKLIIIDKKKLSLQDKIEYLRLRKHINYPKQPKEHNALEDAKWNFELYKFLQQIK